MGKLSVAGIQLDHKENERDYNFQKAAHLITSNPGHDLYVLPELASSGYGAKTFVNLPNLAESERGPSYDFFSKIACEQSTFICYSFPRKVTNNNYCISSGVVGPEGELIGIYDKLHICQFGECFEKDYFTTGKTLSPVFVIKGIKIGLAICYDIRFGELFRKMTLEEGVSLVLHPGGWPRDEAFASWHYFVITRAMENSIYIMSINRAGENNGGSIFCPPFINHEHRKKVLTNEEGLLIGEVDGAYVEEVRNVYTFLKDRRSDLY